MKLGIFSRTYPLGSLDAVLGEIAAEGIPLVHFNLASAGVESLPAFLDAPLLSRIRESFETVGLDMVGVSGTFNAIHPDQEKRREATERCVALIESAPALRTQVVTLCTGSRDQEDMWRAHPENSSQESWRDLCKTLEPLLSAAERADMVLGVEPELANVVDSALKARRLLDEMESRHLKVVLDAANLIRPDETCRLRDVLREALDLTAGDLVMVHAKDLAPEGEPNRQAAGTGLLDFDLYFDLLHEYCFNGPVVMHNLRPDQVHQSAAFVRLKLERFHG